MIVWLPIVPLLSICVSKITAILYNDESFVKTNLSDYFIKRISPLSYFSRIKLQKFRLVGAN